MHFYEYFEWLCKCARVSIPDAYNAAGINKGTVSRWKTAYEKGKPTSPAMKPITAFSAYFKIPVDYFFDMKWKDGLSAEKWIMRGALFAQKRKISAKSCEDVARGAAVSTEDVREFEEFGRPVDVTALYVMCDVIGVEMKDICSDAEVYIRDNPELAAFYFETKDEFSKDEIEGMWNDIEEYKKYVIARERNKKARK